MILEQLRIENFCLFRGSQTFELAPVTVRGKLRPITLFGGMNGGGKTTLLDAIQLALYGNRARCSKRGTLSYDEFLKRSTHQGSTRAKTAGVTVSFRHVLNGEGHLYDVRRHWHLGDGRVKEELRVSCDGLPDAWLTDNWSQLVEELFPLEISQLFFFDAEKIRTLAEEENRGQALGIAIKTLLGLDIVERLIADSLVLKARIIKRVGSQTEGDPVSSLEVDLNERHHRLDKLRAADSITSRYAFGIV
jgi:DNA sulfur modification protein DndD